MQRHRGARSFGRVRDCVARHLANAAPDSGFQIAQGALKRQNLHRLRGGWVPVGFRREGGWT